MARPVRLSACLLLLAGTIAPLASWDLAQGFTAYLRENSGWRAAVRDDATARLSREVGLQAGPTLGLTVTGAGYEDIRGTLATLPAPDLQLLSFPIDGALSGALMLWDPAAADLAALNALETGRSRAALAEFRRDLFADYLVSMANYASASGLVEIRLRTAESYAGLQASAERRQKLGAGNIKDILRAKVAALQAQSSADQALHQASVLRGGWPAALQSLLPPEGTDGSASPEVWLPVFTAAGADLGWLFAGDPPGDLPLPPAVPLDSETWDRRKAAREAEAAGSALLPSVSLYGEASVNATPDLTGSTTWETIFQTGLKLEWNPVSRTASPGTLGLARQQAADKAAAWDDRAADRIRTLGQLASDYRNKVGVLGQRIQTRRIADRLNDSLKTEMDGGSSTLDLLLQGSQLATKAREDEWSARWEVAVSLLVYLKAAGRLVPGEAP